jgi:hypothetical protein
MAHEEIPRTRDSDLKKYKIEDFQENEQGKEPGAPQPNATARHEALSSLELSLRMLNYDYEEGTL